MFKVILDLCGGSGAWSEPWKAAGYDVRVIDLPDDVRLLKFDPLLRVDGILCAPPCTKFSYARNRYPATELELLEGLSVVDACLRAVMIYRPRFWALENPRAKLRHYLGPARLEFEQWEYGDGGVKPTCIWGDFKIPTKKPGPRTKPSTFGTKKQNSLPRDAITPPGFARAFFEANRSI